MLDKLKKNWQWYLMMAAANVLLLLFMACPPTTKSLLNGHTQVTREELQLELNLVTATAAYRMAELAKQDELRQILMTNALLIAEGQPLNPLGIISAVAALYGVGSALTYGKKKVVEKIKNGNSKPVTYEPVP